MTGWTAIIPLNLGRDCKTRLAGRLSRPARDALVDTMARHVVEQVRAAHGITELIILSPERPMIEGVRWRRDEGCGLNAELAATQKTERVLFIHADLPLLDARDIQALLDDADSAGAAIAPDRACTGTNALALRQIEHGFVPQFGKGSFTRHCALLPGAAVVRRPGLALDIDTPDDFDFAASVGALPIACPI